MKKHNRADCNEFSAEVLKLISGGTNGGGIDPGKKEETKTEVKPSRYFKTVSLIINKP